MAEPVKRPLLDRAAESLLFESRAEGKPATIKLSASSEAPVQRWFGNEVLSHESKAVRLGRAANGSMPLLFNHDMGDPIGMVDTARLENRKLMVDAHFFDTARAQEVATMLAGGLRNVSIGYRTYEAEQNKQANTETATDWEPYEVSVVTVPADPSVGINRSEQFDVRMINSAQPAATGEKTMADGETAAAGVSAETKTTVTGGVSAGDMENARVAGIKNICKACKMDVRLQEMFITSGMGLSEVNEEVTKIVTQREANNPKVTSKLGLTVDEARRFSFAKALIAASSGNWSNAGFELDCSRSIYDKLGKPIEPNKFCIPYEVQEGRRDLTVATASAGGYLVGTENQSFIELLRNRTVVYRMGATRLPGLVGNVTIPKQTAAATPVWLANEASTVTESAQTFGQLALSPKTVGAYVEISRQLLLQSAPAAEQIASSDVANVAAIAVDLAALSGSGAGGQPTGITNTAGIGAFTGTTLGAVALLDAQADVIGANVVPVAPGYVTTAIVAGLLMARPELPTTGTTRVWTGSMIDGAIFNLRAAVSAQMAAGTMLFGDWNKLVIGEWGTLEIETNPYANFQAGIIGIRALITIDVGVRYAAAFSLASSIT